jgi:hypothetical protein
MDYIKKEQLEKIVAQQKDLNGVLNNIGILEAQKHAALHQLAGLNEDIEKFKSELEKEYGPINISLEDGSYTKVEESELKVVTDESK